MSDFRPNLRRVTSDRNDGLDAAIGIIVALAISATLWVLLFVAIWGL